ncbi:MAG: RdgB/HAM1 family non-canonical purine NTP pyrophosphatase, partial [Nitrososphaerales archaeon]
MKHTINFVTSNENKFREVKEILSGYDIDVQMQQVDIVEIQADDLTAIAADKARNAYASLKSDLIVEDDGFFVHSLKEFPGPYSAFVYRTIGNEGILKLMERVEDRRAEFISIIAYCDKSLNPETFVGKVAGKVSETRRGSSWGYDPIFIPGSHDLTYAELGARKNEVSHRRFALERFA